MTTTPAIGHNIQTYFDAFADRVKSAVEVANKWLAAYRDKQITDEEQARRCADMIGQLKAEIKAIDEERIAQVKPHLEAQRAINEQAKTTVAPLEAALKLLEPLQRGWLQLVRKRQEEEQQRKAEEARKALAEAEAAKKNAEQAATVQDVVAAEEATAAADRALQGLNEALQAKPQVKGDFATRAVGLRSVWSARIDNLEQATLHYLKTLQGKAKIQEVVQSLGNADARAAKQADMGVPGCVGICEER